MNAQLKAVDIEKQINASGLGLELSKEGKKWVLDNRKFDNLRQVQSYISGLIAINNNSKTIEKTAHQGENAISINKDAIVVLQQSFKAPIPSAIKDKKATADYQEDGGFGTVIKNQLAIENGKLPSELNQVISIRADYAKQLDKYCLPYSIQGNRVVSIHHVAKVKSIIAETNDKLQKVLIEILAKLDDWRDESKAQGLYIDGKFPTVDYFTSKYKVISDFLKLGETFAFEDEITVNAFGNAKKHLSEFVNAVSEYLSGDKKKFRNNNLTNLAESIGILKESGILSGDDAQRVFEIAEKAITETNPEAIRSAKEKVDKGVVVPSKAGRGRKATPVTQEEIEDCQKYLDSALDPLKELVAELEGIA